MVGNRRSIRLKNYDYTREGAYYITICVDDNTCRGVSRNALNINRNVFGYVKNGKMELNKMGQIIYDLWQWLEKQYEYVKLDEFIVMPDHMHGIIFLNDAINDNEKGGSRTAPTKRKSLGRLIGSFKTVSTNQINLVNNTPGTHLWQRNYYEHVIRTRLDLDRIRKYIVNNPLVWKNNEYYT